MDKKIALESYLYGDDLDYSFDILDLEFWVDRIVMFPSLRPLKIEKVVRLCLFFRHNTDFCRELIKRAKDCVYLIFQLYKRGFFEFNDFGKIISSCDSFIFCYYFRKDIINFDSFILQKTKPPYIDELFFKNLNEIDLLIEYGFLPSSIEYCLKYDDVDVFKTINIYNHKYAKWSPFEWSTKPKSLDFLSFSGFFGSIKCFKFIMVNGNMINADVLASVVCSGSFDLFHCCLNEQSPSADCLCKSSEFCHLSLLSFMIFMGIEVNSQSENIFIIFV